MLQKEGVIIIMENLFCICSQAELTSCDIMPYVVDWVYFNNKNNVFPKAKPQFVFVN